MIAQTLATLTRRAPLVALGAAGMTALANPITASAKKRNKNNNKKIKKKARQRCQQQVGQCNTLVTATCNGNEECLASDLPCCEFLGDCNFTGLLTCLAT